MHPRGGAGDDEGGRSDHSKSHYGLGAAAMLRAGVQPDLLGEVIWWSSDDLWIFASTRWSSS